MKALPSTDCEPLEDCSRKNLPLLIVTPGAPSYKLSLKEEEAVCQS